MRLRGLFLGCLSVALAAPASAQIIATSIPREDTGGGTGSNAEHRFALHLMASPFAKWKINSYVEQPKGADFPDLISASSTDSSSKFIGAAELAFAAGSNWTFGVGGWHNALGEPDVDIVEISVIDNPPYVFAGTARQKLNATEFHANLFYKSIGVQAGIVRTSATLTALRAGSTFVFLDTNEQITLPRDFTVGELGVQEEKRTSNNWDAFLVYKYGTATADRLPWTLSLGGGVYRDTQARSSAFSGFATASVGIFKGLGIDASFWYVGKSKPTATRQELGNMLETTLSDNLSRFTIGVGYSFN